MSTSTFTTLSPLLLPLVRKWNESIVDQQRSDESQLELEARLMCNQKISKSLFQDIIKRLSKHPSIIDNNNNKNIAREDKSQIDEFYRLSDGRMVRRTISLLVPNIESDIKPVAIESEIKLMPIKLEIKPMAIKSEIKLSDTKSSVNTSSTVKVELGSPNIKMESGSPTVKVESELPTVKVESNLREKTTHVEKHTKSIAGEIKIPITREVKILAMENRLSSTCEVKTSKPQETDDYIIKEKIKSFDAHFYPLVPNKFISGKGITIRFSLNKESKLVITESISLELSTIKPIYVRIKDRISFPFSNGDFSIDCTSVRSGRNVEDASNASTEYEIEVEAVGLAKSDMKSEIKDKTSPICFMKNFLYKCLSVVFNIIPESTSVELIDGSNIGTGTDTPPSRIEIKNIQPKEEVKNIQPKREVKNTIRKVGINSAEINSIKINRKRTTNQIAEINSNLHSESKTRSPAPSVKLKSIATVCGPVQGSKKIKKKDSWQI